MEVQYQIYAPGVAEKHNTFLRYFSNASPQ